MIYIQKSKTPEAIKLESEKIKKTPGSGYAEIQLPRDSKQLRFLFEQMPKADIRTSLFQEQHGLCAYCMSRIGQQSTEMKVEHYEALSENKELALDYQNYLGVCYGGENNGSEVPRILCCDAVRENRPLTINPWNKRQMDAVAYYRNGEIFIRNDKGLDADLVSKMQYDVDNCLGLNGAKDKNGKIIYDTSTKIVASRRSICDSVHTQFERWAKKKCLTSDFLQEKIEKLEKTLSGDNIADPYIGVRLYLFRRKQEKLKRQGL